MALRVDWPARCRAGQRRRSRDGELCACRGHNGCCDRRGRALGARRRPGWSGPALRDQFGARPARRHAGQRRCNRDGELCACRGHNGCCDRRGRALGARRRPGWSGPALRDLFGARPARRHAGQRRRSRDGELCACRGHNGCCDRRGRALGARRRPGWSGPALRDQLARGPPVATPVARGPPSADYLLADASSPLASAPAALSTADLQSLADLALAIWSDALAAKGLSLPAGAPTFLIADLADGVLG